MSMGGSKSESSNNQDSQSQTFVDPNQAPFLQFLREQGQALAGGQLGAGGFQDMMGNANFTFGQMLAGGGGNPHLQGQIDQGQQSINRNLGENIMPMIGSGAANMGQRGSSRQGVAEGIAARGAIEQGANFENNMRFQDFNQGRQNQLSALALAPSIGGLGFQPLQNFSNLLGAPSILGSSTSKGRGESTSKSLGF